MLRVTQEAVEIVRKPSNAEVRVTASVTEVLRCPASRRARTSQTVVEVLRANAAPPSGGGRQPIVMIVAG